MQKGKCSRGFSLVEVLIAVGIMAVIAAVALPSFFQGHNQADLNGTSSQIVSTLRTAQSQAVSQVKGAAWGVHFSNNVASSSFGAYISGVNGSSGDGKITGIGAETVDPSGNIYVADLFGYRIEKYDVNDNFVRTWGWGVQDGASSFENCTSGCQSGISGNPSFPESGRFDAPDGIAYSNGHIYVSDFFDGDIQEFDTNGNFVQTFGTLGSGAGQMNAPNQISFDSGGNVLFVADGGNHRVDLFYSDKTFVQSFGWGVADGANAFETCYTTCQAGIYGSSTGEFENPESVVQNRNNGDLYVLDNISFTLTTVQRFSYSEPGFPYTHYPFVYDSTFSVPFSSDLAIDDNGNLYSGSGSTKSTGQVGMYNASGTLVSQFDSQGSGSSSFTGGTIAIDASGSIYLGQTGAVSKFVGNTVPHVLLNQWITSGTGAGQTGGTAGTAIDSSGNIYVADAQNNRIQKFNASGTFITMWGYGVQDGANALETCTSGCQTAIAGTGVGQMENPVDVAVGSNGNIYVADNYVNNRIEEYSSSGAYITEFGSPGTGAGQFYSSGAESPSAIGVDTSGNVYVADTGQYRVEKFNSSGTFLTMWGWGVQDGASALETCTSGCQAGITGTGNGEMGGYGPQALAVDPTGNVWVDDANNRIQEFSSGGAYLGGFTPTTGAGNGQVNYTRGLSFDSSGHLWVADSGSYNDRVTEFSQSGAYIDHIGGWDDSTFSGSCGNVVKAVVSPTNGNIYVNCDHIYEFSGTPLYGTSGGGSSGGGSTSGSAGSGSYYAIFTGSTYNAANVQDTYPLPSDLAFVSSSVPVGSSVDVIFSPITGSTAAARIGLYVVNNPSLVSWINVNSLGQVSISNSTPAAFGTYIWQFGAASTTIVLAGHPTGVSVDANKNTYVIYFSYFGGGIEKFDSNGNFLYQLGTNGTGGNGQLGDVTDIAFDPSGNVYALDTGFVGGNPLVEKFSSSGSFISQFGSIGTGAGQFTDPDGLAIDPSGNIFITDTANNRIEEYNSGGTFIKTWGWGVQDGASSFETCTSGCQAGVSGAGNGQLDFPVGIALDSSGNIYVTDTGNNRVEEFSSSGAYVSKFGSSGSGNGQFVNAQFLAIGSNGNIYVVDGGNGGNGGNNRVEEFNSSGTYISQFGSYGSSTPTQFQTPIGIGLDSSGALYVSDNGNNRIGVFGSGN
jgi:prepilin-type N-terminal cleavage/methylation domain-containing protein